MVGTHLLCRPSSNGFLSVSTTMERGVWHIGEVFLSLKPPLTAIALSLSETLVGVEINESCFVSYFFFLADTGDSCIETWTNLRSCGLPNNIMDCVRAIFLTTNSDSDHFSSSGLSD